MRYLLGRPRPDELLTSVLVRTLRTVPFPPGAALASLHGTARGPNPGLLSFPYVREMSSAWRAAPQEVIWSHTMVPYATAFLPAGAYGRAMHSAVSISEQRTGLGALTQSISTHVPFCRFCRICSDQDVATWGDSYWRRAHHLPGVLFCPTHRSPLVVTAVPTLARKLLEMLPHELEGAPAVWKPSQLELRVARASVLALNRPIGLGEEPTAAGYRARMVEVGLLSEGRDVDAGRLQAWIRAATAGDQLNRLAPDGEAEIRAMPRLLMRVHCPQSPVARHLLFRALLDGASGKAASLLDFSPVGPRRSPMVEQDARFAAAAKKLAQEAIRRGERVRIIDILQQVGCWTSFRHRRQDFPKLRAFVVWLKASPACSRPNWGRGGTPRVRSVMRMKP